MNWQPFLINMLEMLPIDTQRWLARANRLTKFSFWSRVRKWQNFLRQTQHWSGEQLVEYQWRQMSLLLNHAYQFVPFYQQLFRNLSINPRDIKNIDIWHTLPLLAKSDIQLAGTKLLATNCPPNQRQYLTTGGSTGIPVGIYFDKLESDAMELAFILTLWARVGYHVNARSAILRGAVIGNGRLWQINPLHNQMVLSSYHLTDDNLLHYLDHLHQFRPEFIQAYPSAISMLAKFVLAQRLSPPKSIQAILCGSENLYEWQRKQIEQAFQCRVYSWYGQTEKVCLAGECEHDQRLHIFPEYGYVELIDNAGRVIEEPGQMGEIVATGFLSKAMPLLRYRTMDYAIYAPGYCEKCGRHYRLFERIEGRLQEFIVTANGRYISMTAINMHSPVFDHVNQFRFYQDTPGKVKLYLVRKSTYTENDNMSIQRELAPKLGSDVELTLEFVEEISRTERGKYRFLDQHLPLQFGDQ